MTTSALHLPVATALYASLFLSMTVDEGYDYQTGEGFREDIPTTYDVQFGKGWNCCKDAPYGVVVFSNRARWAVCKACYGYYTGEKYPMLRDATKAPIDVLMDLQIRVEVAVGRHIRYCDEIGDRRAGIMNTASVELSEAPRNAQQRRQHAIAVVLYKHVANGAYDVPAILNDIEAMIKLGRTTRWQGQCRTWANMIRNADLPGGMDWALDQGAIFVNYAA
jgi:hypothetical protein